MLRKSSPSGYPATRAAALGRLMLIALGLRPDSVLAIASRVSPGTPGAHRAASEPNSTGARVESADAAPEQLCMGQGTALSRTKLSFSRSSLASCPIRIRPCEKTRVNMTQRPVCVSIKLHERADFYRRFTGGFARKACSQGHSRHSMRCMQILQPLNLQDFILSRSFWRWGRSSAG